MAEQSLSDIVIHLISWIESLHEKNLKYEAQVESLTRDLAKAQTSYEQLEARLSAYQKPNQQHHQHQPNIDETKLTHSQQLQQLSTSTPTTSSTSIYVQQANGSDQQQQNQMISSDQHHLLSPQSHQDHHQQQHQHILQHKQLTIGDHTAPANLQHVANQSQHPQVIYQPIPIASGPSFVTQPQYVWTTYDSAPTSGGYYDQYNGPTVVASTFVPSQP